MLHVGIDLHGTLITDHSEEVPPTSRPRLLAAMERVKGLARLYVCTGNDLGFLHRKLPTEVLDRMDGAVLETGCVVSDLRTETILVDPLVVRRVKMLEGLLQEKRFEWVYKFARRLATVSLFTRRGLCAADFRDEVERQVQALGFSDVVIVTYSSVAVDVIPRGFNKLTGLRRLAGSEPAVGIADSMNDLELIRGADYAFLPANSSPELLERLRQSGKRIERIPVSAAADTMAQAKLRDLLGSMPLSVPERRIGEATGLQRDVPLLAAESFTDAVSQSLEFIAEHV